MPRRAQLSVPGIPWHIIQRGNNRTACFYADEDYRLYLDHLQALSSKFSCAVRAYVLMMNHVHLLLTPEKEESSTLSVIGKEFRRKSHQLLPTLFRDEP